MTNRYFIITAASLVAIVVGCVAVQDSASTSKVSKAEKIAHGEYLVTSIAGCGNCHTPKGPDGEIAGMALAGGFKWDEPAFLTYSDNITPDNHTGIGNWTIDQIVVAIREGKRPDGTTIGPPMPFEFYRDISDDDAYAMAGYLKTIEPIANDVPDPEYNFPLPDAYGPPLNGVPAVMRDKPAAYGAYLAGPVGHCMECHTPRDDENHLMLDTSEGAGGREFHGPYGVSVAADIRAGDPTHGLGAWSDDEIKTAITQGIRADGSPLKPPMAFGYYARMTDADLSAVVAYLRTLTP